MTSHLCRAFAPTLITPAQDNIQRGNIFHLPFLRLPAQGAPWVALFFLLTGYVNSMRPIKQARNGSINPALSGLASSTLRRTGRLVLPATIATLLSWLLCQVGAFDVGTKCDAAWVRDTSPAPGPGLEGSLRMLASNVYTTWTSGANEYDKNQWTFAFFLKGSMLIYVTLLATVRTQPRYRMLVFLGLYAYSWAGRDRT